MTYLQINQIYNEDCLLGMEKIQPNSIDLVLCDMPYGTTSNKWDSVIDLDKIWKLLYSISNDKRLCILFGQMPFTATLVSSNTKDFKYNWIWQKPTGTGHLNAKKAPLKNHEDILVFYSKQPVYNPQFTEGSSYKTKSGNGSKNYGKQIRIITENKGIRYPKTVLNFNKDKDKFHPTQKPVALMEYLIKTYTNEGDIILDFCIGSGTTAIAAINTKRNYIGFEKDKDYYKIASNRIQEHK